MKQIPLELQKMELVGRVATTVIHDLNNLLTVIQLNAAMLEIGDLEEGEGARLVEEINRACSCASDLTRSVLSFSRRSERLPTRFEIGKVLSDLVPLLGVLSGKKACLVTDFPKEKLWIEGVAVEFQQIILNLVSNAIDSEPRAGVTLKVQGVTEGGQDMVEILVEDTGKGIPTENLSSIFEPFFSTKEQGRGTGLGLYIVQRIVNERGGLMEVESAPDVGTRFRLLFPQSLEESAPVTIPEVAVVDRSFEKTILLVEDDAGIRAIGRQILERKGSRVLEAADATEAIKIWEEYKSEIAMLFTDIVLPGSLHGDALARELLLEQPDLKVLYTSGNLSAAHRSAEFAEVNFLQKPYRPEALVQAVGQLLS